MGTLAAIALAMLAIAPLSGSRESVPAAPAWRGLRASARDFDYLSGFLPPLHCT